MRVSYTLLADGTSDRALMRLIAWTLRGQDVAIERGAWADLSRVSPKPRTLSERVGAALELNPCNILFVHRDAERECSATRIAEVREATADLPNLHVPVVPVRMTEAWLLHDEQAIRQASGNPSGTVALDFPTSDPVEELPDPKDKLSAALLTASELSGRRRRKKQRELPRMRTRVAELIDSFAPLRRVPAFERFVADLESVLRTLRNPETSP